MKLSHDVAAIGEDRFEHALHAQALHVLVRAVGIDGVVSGHQGRIEGVDAADARVGGELGLISSPPSECPTAVICVGPLR